ncbi:MAG: PLDc N-terminal domain-containing protein [Nitrososphaerales archaeon]
MTKLKKWSELPTGQKVAGLLLAVVQYSLLIAALWDIWHRPVDRINGNRRIWTTAVFVNFIGPIAYFLFGRKRD